MKKMTIALFMFWLMVGAAHASGGGAHLEHAAVDIGNTPSLQRGAKFFFNYCLSCHSAQYSRYNRVAEDLDLTEAQMEDNMIFADAGIRDHMIVTMDPADAKEWFGTTPPDLTLVARAKGADYVYSYLRSFYLDESRPFGVNNLVLENAAMPHVLWELQGWQKPVYAEEEGPDGKPVIEHLELVAPGKMSEEEFDRASLDLVNFLVYLSEPVLQKREHVGFWVLAFLVLLFVITYLLKKEYWKDVH